MASGLKSLLFFRHSTAVMMMMMTVTTAMGASTAAMIQRLLGGFLTTAGTEKNNCAATFGQKPPKPQTRCWELASSAFCTSHQSSSQSWLQLSAPSPSAPLLWPQFSHPPFSLPDGGPASPLPPPPTPSSPLTPTPAPLSRLHGLESRALASVSVSASVYSPTHQVKEGAVLTFGLQLDEVAQGERHGLRVHCVQDLGRGRAGQGNAAVLDVIGHLHGVPGARHPADAHHLMESEEGGTRRRSKSECLCVAWPVGKRRMDGGEHFRNASSLSLF